MTRIEKVNQLRSLIFKQLKPLISTDVALFGIVNHGNTGDTLITLGELDFLKQCGCRIRHTQLLIDESPYPDLPKDCTILLQGGGDFGDMWRGIQERKLSIIKHYSEHRIIIFPESVHYHEQHFLLQDSEMLNQIHDLTICARDRASYEVLKQHFTATILLIPDMAFCIHPQSLKQYISPNPTGTLYLKRIDKEQSNEHYDIQADSISDWPTINNDSTPIRRSMLMIGYKDGFRLRGMNLCAKALQKINLWYVLHTVYPHVVQSSVRFLSSYSNLYLTRLHSAILSILIDKPFTLLDNSYHKNQNFYQTWLSDVDDIKLKLSEL